MCDFGTGNNNKLNWVLEDKQEMIDIIETIYRGAKKGRGLVVSPKGKLNNLLYFNLVLISCQITRPGIATKRLISVKCRLVLKIVKIGVVHVVGSRTRLQEHGRLVSILAVLPEPEDANAV